MKRSTKILAELHSVLDRVRQLHAEAEANQPLRYNRNLSDMEQRDNECRRDKIDQLTRDITNAEAEAAQLRKAYGLAMQAEQAPKTEGPSEALQRLYEKRAELKTKLDQAREDRSQNSLKAAEGDSKAQKKMQAALDTHALASIEISNLDLAIEVAKGRDIQDRVASAEADADERHRAGLAAAENLIAWGYKTDNFLDYLSNHFAQLPDLKKALAKSGANTDISDRALSKATFDRAAKAKGLHHFFSIDATVDAAALGATYEKLLKSAVRRPDISKGKAA